MTTKKLIFSFHMNFFVTSIDVNFVVESSGTCNVCIGVLTALCLRILVTIQQSHIHYFSKLSLVLWVIMTYLLINFMMTLLKFVKICTSNIVELSVMWTNIEKVYLRMESTNSTKLRRWYNLFLANILGINFFTNTIKEQYI